MSNQIDPRGQQFNAVLTSVLLAVVLVTAPSPFGIALLAVQATLFATAVFLGVHRTPAAFLYKNFICPRLSAPASLEDSAAPRFAQGVGLAFTVLALVGFIADLGLLGPIAIGFALVAAVLNATLRLCLGCKLYGVCKLPTTTNIQSSTNKKEVLA